MTGAVWLSSSDPAAMLSILTGEYVGPKGLGSTSGRLATASARKLRLFACACARAVWPLLADPRSRRAVEVAERYADGDVNEAVRAAAYSAALSADEAVRRDPSVRQDRPYTYAAMRACDSDTSVRGGGAWLCLPSQAAAQAALLRDLFGNPYRPAAIGRTVRAAKDMSTAALESGAAEEWHPPPWLTTAALGIARRAYDGRDFAALPVLADALEEAGCDDDGLLLHLRGRELCPGRRHSRGPDDGADGWMPLRGAHARGCWALDLVLGKE